MHACVDRQPSRQLWGHRGTFSMPCGRAEGAVDLEQEKTSFLAPGHLQGGVREKAQASLRAYTKLPGRVHLLPPLCVGV
jgi:hypothetical protein